MTRGLPHALFRLLALLACVMCCQSASRGVAQPWVDDGTRWGGAEEAAVRADGPETRVLPPALPGGLNSDGTPANAPGEDRESDDDEDQGDDFDDPPLLGLHRAAWDCSGVLPGFGAPLFHDPICSGHRLLDPRPPRRC